MTANGYLVADSDMQVFEPGCHLFLLDYQRDSFGVGAPTDAVLEVCGSPPEDFESIVRRLRGSVAVRRAELRIEAPSGGRLVKALLTPAPRLEAIADRLQLPRISHAMLAAENG